MNLDQIHGRDLHPHVIRAAESGHFTILDLFDNLPWLKTGADWTAWRAFLCALYGLPMTEEEYGIYQTCTGRSDRPSEPHDEAWLPVGRRARKTAVIAVVALYNAAYRRDYKPFIAPGETPTVPILAKDKYEAKQAHSYLSAILSDARLNYLLDGEPSGEEIRLKVPGPTGDYPVSMIVRAATITAARSRAVLTAVFDEVAFFRSEESANPDEEILRGVLPGMANIPGAMVLGISSPFAPRGLLYDKHKNHFGKTPDVCRIEHEHSEDCATKRVLVWQSDTTRMHSTPQIRATVAKAYRDDKIAAEAEYGGKFRADMVGFVTEETIRAVTKAGRYELPPVEGKQYFGFVDASGGASDSFTLGVAHVDHGGTRIVLDAIRERTAPFDPKAVVKEWAPLIKSYGLNHVTGDYYAGEWVGSEFRSHKVGFVPSELSKSEIFVEFLPHLNAGQVELLDVPTISKQFVSLVRRVSAGGKETITHPSGGHDDVANAVAGAMVRAGVRLRREQRKADHEAANPPAKTVEEQETRKIHDFIKKAIKDKQKDQKRERRSPGL